MMASSQRSEIDSETKSPDYGTFEQRPHSHISDLESLKPDNGSDSTLKPDSGNGFGESATEQTNRTNLRKRAWRTATLENLVGIFFGLCSTVLSCLDFFYNADTNDGVFIASAAFFIAFALYQYGYGIFLILKLGAMYHKGAEIERRRTNGRVVYNGLTYEVDVPHYVALYLGSLSFGAIIALHYWDGDKYYDAASMVNIISTFVLGSFTTVAQGRLQEEISSVEASGVEEPSMWVLFNSLDKFWYYVVLDVFGCLCQRVSWVPVDY